MNYIAELGNGTEMKFYYTDKVYDPNYSSIETAILANGFIYDGKEISVLDVAAGCGITGLILKRIHPNIWLTLADIDPEAVRISKLNAKRLGIKAEIVEADLLPDNKIRYDVITANLPTFDVEQMAEEELHGPEQAYNGGIDGMILYKRLFKEAVGRCKVLVCECQVARQAAFLSVAALNGWKVIGTTGMSFALVRDDIVLNSN